MELHEDINPAELAAAANAALKDARGYGFSLVFIDTYGEPRYLPRAEIVEMLDIHAQRRVGELLEKERAPKKVGRPAKWPFAAMEVGDEVVINREIANRGRVTAHAYGNNAGKKFRTRRNDRGDLIVTRVS